MTPSRVSIICSDPMFSELVAHYERKQENSLLSVQRKFEEATEDVLDEIRERLEDPDQVKEMSMSQLLEILTRTADRAGHGPQSKNVNETNINVNLAGRLEAARKRIADKLPVIEADYSEVTDG